MEIVNNLNGDKRSQNQAVLSGEFLLAVCVWDVLLPQIDMT
jgi:hypothetical protein